MGKKRNPETWGGDMWAVIDEAGNLEPQTLLLVEEVLPPCFEGIRPFHKSFSVGAPDIVAARACADS